MPGDTCHTDTISARPVPKEGGPPGQSGQSGCRPLSQVGSQPAPGSGRHSGAAAHISGRGPRGKGCRLCGVRLPTCHALLEDRAEPRTHSPWRDLGKRVRWASREESTAPWSRPRAVADAVGPAPPPRPGRAASAGSAGGDSVVHPSSQDNRSCPVGCEPWGPQSLLGPAPGRLPAAPTQEVFKPRGPDSRPARRWVTVLAAPPSGHWAGVGTSRPYLWARSSLPQSPPAALCPAFLASPAAPNSCRAGGRMFPQRYTAQEFTLSPGLSRPEPSALRAHTSRVCSQRRRRLRAGGLLDGTPHMQEVKSSPLWMSDKGQQGSCTSGS